MKTRLVAGAVLACTVAVAAATPSIADSGGVPWNGFYIGANLGDAFKPSDLSFRDLSAPQDLSFRGDSASDSLVGGVHGGYGWWNSGGLYTGIEGDVDWAKRMNYLASVRGRLGFGGDRWLAYGTAGVGFISAKDHFTVFDVNDPTTTFSRTRRQTGFVGGAGLEYALSTNTTLGVEGLWYAFGSDRHTLPTSTGEPFSVRDDRNFGVVRARLTYYFD